MPTERVANGCYPFRNSLRYPSGTAADHAQPQGKPALSDDGPDSAVLSWQRPSEPWTLTGISLLRLPHGHTMETDDEGWPRPDRYG
jgi:hypothetical protein